MLKIFKIKQYVIRTICKNGVYTILYPEVFNNKAIYKIAKRCKFYKYKSQLKIKTDNILKSLYCLVNQLKFKEL